MRAVRLAVSVLLVIWAVPSVEAAVTGRVLASDGRPLAGARVAAFALEASLERSSRLVSGRARVPVASAASAADGSFRLETALAVVDLEAAATGFQPAFARVADGERAVLALRNAPTVKGQVVAAGRPVAGATVVWMAGDESGERYELVQRSGPDGGYELPAPAGWAGSVLVTHPDFAPLSSGPGVAGWGSVLRHELGPGTAVEGRVVEVTTGRSVAGATVFVDGWPLGRSDAGGAFLVRHAPSGWSTLEARTDALAGTAEPRAGRLLVPAEPLRRLSGTVRDLGSGRPLGGAVVTLHGRDGTESSTPTDGAGRYAVTLSEGRYYATVTRQGFAAATEGQEEADAIDLHRSLALRRDFGLERLRRLTGRVQDEARRPVGGALVRLCPKQLPRLYSLEERTCFVAPSTWTAPDGGFAIAFGGEGTDETEWTVVALKEGYAMGVVEPVRATNAAPRVVVTLPAGLEMAGRVTDPEGKPIPDVAVVIAESGGAPGTLRAVLAGFADEGWTRSGADGRFATRVRPTAHELVFLGRGRSPKAVHGHDPSGGAVLDVVLDPSVEIRGRVLRSDGTGVAGVQLFTWGRASRGRPPPPHRATAASPSPDCRPGPTRSSW